MSNEKEKSVFIGARTLNKEEVKIIVPTFDAIMSRIEDIRIQAHAKHYENKEKWRKQIKKYNNTITLFGNRGTGKTSTMYTVINELSKNKLNVLLEIIEPDNIGPEGKIIGCILGLFKNEMSNLNEMIKRMNSTNPRELKDSIKKDFFDNCRFIENNPLNQAYNEVLEYYCYTESEYKKLLTCNYNDMNSYIKKSSYMLNADIEFTKKFEIFIDKFIEYKKNLMEEEEENLIFIFIDDVDLNTNKCQEIIEAILRYASHPNIICIITGDYNTFTEEFTIALLKKEKLVEANLFPKVEINNGMRILESKQVLAHEYMKKVFPPAYRHYVNTWSLSLIPQYIFAIDTNEKRDNLFQLLDKISKYISELNKNNISLGKSNEIEYIENIFGCNSDDENKIIYFLPSYNMFDKTSRGLTNVYYSFNNLSELLDKFVKCEKEYNESEFFINVKILIENIIDSSSILVKYNQEIKNKYILWGANQRQSKIDFQLLENLFRDTENKEIISKDRNKVEIKYAIFYICYYMSILLPNIQYAKEKRIDVLKLAIFDLIANPKLNGYDTSIKCDDTTRQYFTNSRDYSGYHIKYCNYAYYTYYINYMLFTRDMLVKLGIEFGQKLYKNIVNSKLLGYEFFDENFKMDEEKYNILYLTFYKSLYDDDLKNLDLMINFYSNENLNPYRTFLESKSNEEDESHYMEMLFKNIFQAVDKKINVEIDNMKDSINSFEEIKKISGLFLRVIKLEFKKLIIGKYNDIVPNNIIESIKVLINEYNEVISKKLQADYEEERKKSSKIKVAKTSLDLSKLLYKVHENEINEKKENLYVDDVVINKVNEFIVEINVYEMVDMFLYNIYKIKNILSSAYVCHAERFLNINLSSSKILEKIDAFLKSKSGSTWTIADDYKIEFNTKFKQNSNSCTLDDLNIVQYYEFRDIFNRLLVSNARYCKDEARDLLKILDENAIVTINDNEKILSNEGIWVMQAYSLFMQKSNPKLVDISELKEAKTYLKNILPKAKEKQTEKETDFLKKFEIELD